MFVFGVLLSRDPKMILAIWSNVIPWHYTRLCLIEKKIIFVKGAASSDYFFIQALWFYIKLFQNAGVQLTTCLCISHLFSLPFSLMIISSQKYVTRPSFLCQICFLPQREMQKVLQGGSLLPNTGFKDLVEQVLVYACYHLTDVMPIWHSFSRSVTFWSLL